MATIKVKQARLALNILTRLEFSDAKNKYAKTRNLLKLKSIVEKSDVLLNEADFRNCLTNKETGATIELDGKLQFSPESRIKCETEKRAIIDADCDIDPYLFSKNEETVRYQDSMVAAEVDFLLGFTYDEPADAAASPATVTAGSSVMKDDEKPADSTSETESTTSDAPAEPAIQPTASFTPEGSN